MLSTNIEPHLSMNLNPVLSVTKDGTVLYSNAVGEPLLNEWGVRVGERLPSSIVDLVQRVSTLNSPEKIEIKVGVKVYLIVFHPSPEEECIKVSGFDISEQKEFEEKIRDNEPQEKANTELIDVVDIQAIKPLMEDFYKLTHIPIGLNYKGNVLLSVGWKDICTKFHRVNPETCKHCVESNTILSVGVLPGEFKLYKCKNNMWDATTPLIVGSEHVGNIFAGQFFFEDEPLDYELFRSQARKYGFNEEEYIKALEKVPRLSRDTVETGMSFFTTFANMISQLSYSNVKLAKSLSERDALVDELQKNQVDFDRAQTVGNLGSWRLNVRQNKLTWSDEVYRIFGIPKGITLTYESFLSTVHPDDREYVNKKWKAGLAGEPYDIEHRIIAEDRIKWVREKAYNEFDNSGVLLGGFGIVQDITERKQAEEEVISAKNMLQLIMNNIPQAIFWKDCNSRLMGCNEVFAEDAGVQFPEYIVGKTDYDLPWTREQTAWYRECDLRVMKNDTPEYHIIEQQTTSEGKLTWLDTNKIPLHDAKGNVIGILGTYEDITERKKAEEALKLLNLYNRSLIEASLDPLVTIGHDGKITDVNKATERVTGYSRNELIGTDFSDYFTEPEKAKKGYQKVFEEGFVIDYELEIRNKNGKVTPILYNASVYKDESSNVIGVFAAARDITESKKAEEVLKKAHDTLEGKVKERTVELEKAYNLLKESEKGLAEAQKMAHLGNWSWNIETGELCWSDELYRIFGLSPQEFRITYDIFLNYVHPDDREYLINAIKEGLNGSSGSVNCRIILDNGEERILYLEAKVFFYEENTTLQVKGIAQDITEYKKIEYKLRESEEKYRNIIETANEGIGIIDARGIVTFANKKLWDMLGYSVDESYNKSAIDLIEDIDDFKRKIEDRRKGNSDVYELKAVRKDGSKLWVLASVKPLFNEKGKYLGSLGMFTDISKRKEAEVTLKKIDIARKQEIHHRIKNNLQVISSLLDLQAEKFKGKQNLKETEVLEAFKESQDRVISMALIHEELHKGREIDTLNVSHYIKELADNLFLTYRLGNEGISLVMDIEEDTYFDMDTAVPLGIIINELVSNSLKHAFSGRDKGDIRIKLYTEEIRENKTERIKSKTFVLSTSDNGIGIPEDNDIVELDSLGIQLITTLVEQLDGELELKRENGTEFIVRFTVTEKPKEESLPVVEDSEATDKTTQLTLHKFCLPE